MIQSDPKVVLNIKKWFKDIQKGFKEIQKRFKSDSKVIQRDSKLPWINCLWAAAALACTLVFCTMASIATPQIPLES